MASVLSVKRALNKALRENSELQLLKILKHNSFLFSELFYRKNGVQPIFHEVSFGGELRCDFVWLNDNSDGPEWTLVEVEKPDMVLFNKNKKPSAELTAAIDQVKSWKRYFEQNHAEKGRIFGAVKNFRFILITGTKIAWESENATIWRASENNSAVIEIRSMDVFNRALELYSKKPNDFWSFEEHPITLPHTQLSNYWKSNSYISKMRLIFK